MKASYFTTSELNNYFDNDKIVFFNHRKCFLLTKENNLFNFKELPEGKTKTGDMQHTKKGRFHAFKISDSYCKNYNIENII